MKRFGMITKIKPEMLNNYIELHNRIWDEVVKAAHENNLRNYSIFHKDGLLFSYFEYVGNDYENDMIKKNNLPIIKKWQQVCDECFERINGNDRYSVLLDEIFHNSFA